jgi:sentrin-specific protease 1
MEGIVYTHPNPLALCITPSSLAYKRNLKRAAEDSEDELQRPSADLQPAETQQPAPTRVITGMLATIPQSIWYFGTTLITGLVDLISSRHAPPAQQQAAQQHAATSQPTQITSVGTDHSDRKRRAVDTSPINASHSSTSPSSTSLTRSSPTTRAKYAMYKPCRKRAPGISATVLATSPAAFERNSAKEKEAAATRAAWYKRYHDPTLENLAKELKLARAQQSGTTTQPAAVDKTIPIKDRQIGSLIQKAQRAQGTTTAQRAVQKRQAAQQKKKAAEEQAAAEKEAADIAAAEEAARLELEKEEVLIAAEQEKQRVAAEEEKQCVAAEEEAQRVAAEVERQRVQAEDDLFGPLLEATGNFSTEASVAAAKENERIAAEERAAEEADINNQNRRSLQTVVTQFPGDLGIEIENFAEFPKADRDTVIQAGGIPLQSITFRRILSAFFGNEGTDSWLDDDAVNAWYNILVEERKKMMGYVKGDNNPPVIANLQSAWYAKYQKEKAKGLKRWLKRAGVGGTNMLKCERIFLPINTGNHWTLLIINGANRSIEYLDSLGGSGTRYFEIARDLLKSELGADYHEKEWMDLKRNRSSRQSNMDDCGVFTCMNGLAAAKDNPYKEVTAEQMPDARIMMAAVFFNKGFKDVVWW